MKKNFILKFLKICLKIIETILTFVIIVLSCIIITQRITNNEKSVFGYRIFRIETGSMVPNYLVGDVILVKSCKTSELKPGDNITYNGLTGDVKGKIITHQIVAVNNENNKLTIRTKGIANNTADPEIDASQVIGKVIVKLELLTCFTRFFNNKYIFYFVIIVPVTIWIFLTTVREKTNNIKKLYESNEEDISDEETESQIVEIVDENSKEKIDNPEELNQDEEQEDKVKNKENEEENEKN